MAFKETLPQPFSVWRVVAHSSSSGLTPWAEISPGLKDRSLDAITARSTLSTDAQRYRRTVNVNVIAVPFSSSPGPDPVICRGTAC
jgi:hypothetical protein